MHPSKNRNPLTWRLLLATLVSSSFFLAGSTLADSQGFFSSEEDFLANADAGWVKIADNVYEKQMPNGEIVHHGFGPEAIEFFLVSAKVKKQELLELARPRWRHGFVLEDVGRTRPQDRRSECLHGRSSR